MDDGWLEGGELESYNAWVLNNQLAIEEEAEVAREMVAEVDDEN